MNEFTRFNALQNTVLFSSKLFYIQKEVFMSLTYTYNCAAEFGHKLFVYDPYLSHELNFISMIVTLYLKNLSNNEFTYVKPA